MQRLSEAEIFEKLDAGEFFECESQDGGFILKVEAYTPAICAAIHAGHNLRTRLLPLCNLDEDERLQEEDPFTDQFINAMPITLIAQDSRYEYDLNRPLSRCIYRQAWGKKVWRKALPAKERAVSIAKYQLFYRVLDALISSVEERFGAALVFDIHSYNHLERDELTPTFNLGTEQIDCDRWKNVIATLLARLPHIELPNMPVVVESDRVFYGRGHLISHLNGHFENTLVLPLEIKKIFMDELNGEPYPLVMQALSQQFKECLTYTSADFSRRYTSKRRAVKTDMLTEKMDAAILRVDGALYKLARGLETLHYINPINIQTEKRNFFRNNGNYQPEFRYRQLNIDPFSFKQELYRLPVDTIRDPGIQSLYRDVIDGLGDKIDLLAKAGTPQFVYESLKYYGEPSVTDEYNANFLLHAEKFEEISTEACSTDELVDRFEAAANQWNMKCKVETSSRLVASAMVSNSRKTVILAKELNLPHQEASALVHHELGVHMATTLNSDAQRLKVFSLGLPGNTLAQEGLAILNEYQSGNMTLERLKGLALRVLAVKKMLEKGDFRHTYSYLYEQQGMSSNDAFKLSVRVHRGGGFTKDFLYLNGVSQALYLARDRDIRNLYVGKTGFDYLPIIDEMVARQLVVPPQYVPEYLEAPIHNSPVMDYLMGCIRCDSTDKLAA
jgi:uncharacterized protein (TIGR02421 family)